MPAPFPHHYHSRLVRTLSSRARIEAPPRAPIAAGPPVELDGDATSWSPEHLLLSSIGMCLLTTFEAFAARDHVELLAWEASVSGTLAKTSQGLEFTEFHVEVAMEVSDGEAADRALADAERHCPIVNALRAHVEVVATYTTPGSESCSTYTPRSRSYSHSDGAPVGGR
jgi:organic hydroperoxide reductase OsmC/OhrA